jgi:transglutaminase-like putative cysteine protease
MMKYLLLVLVLCFNFQVFAQSKYVYSEIPDSLKENADYIVWEELMEFSVKTTEKAVIKLHKAVCIINKHSKYFDDIYIHYNKDNSIRNFKAVIFDKNGQIVKKFKRSELKDISAVTSHSLYQDDMYLVAEFIHNQYPYTLYYEYEQDIIGLLNYPSWNFQKLPKMGVLSSKIKVSVPENMNLRYKEYNLKNKVRIETNENTKFYIWEEKNLKPIELSSNMPPSRYFLPELVLAPSTFKEGGIESKMNSWKELGQWERKLNEGRDILPESAKETVKELVKNAANEKEKIKILYKFMQGKTRYVSVQLGIGGQQTYPANYVEEKGYGDCKALSNYMYSMLKEIGIKSYYTTVFAGKNEPDIIVDFPSNQFNHVILCVPLREDTIWLECTNQQNPFNFLGSHSDDRHALLITEEGGKLVKTPRYGKEINTQYRNIELKLDAEGHATAKVHTEFSGLQYENREGWSGRSVKEQKDALKETYAVSGMEINDFKFTEFKNEIPSIHEDLDLTILRFASTSGKRMFIKMNVFNQASYVPKNEERKIPFRLTYEFIDTDTVNLEIPEGYTIENQPKDYDLSTKFGSYSCKFEQNGNKIRFIRTHSSEKGIFPAEDYKDYYEFRKTIKKADKAKLVLVKNS